MSYSPLLDEDRPDRERFFRDSMRLDRLADIPQVRELIRQCPAVRAIFQEMWEDCVWTKNLKSAAIVRKVLQAEGIDYTEQPKGSGNTLILPCRVPYGILVQERRGVTLLKRGPEDKLNPTSTYKHEEIEECMEQLRTLLATSGYRRGSRRTRVWGSWFKSRQS